MMHIILQGAQIKNINDFYLEMSRHIGGHGKNLDAFDDALYGGLSSEFAEGETATVTWIDSDRSQARLKGDFDTIVNILKDHKNIVLELK